MANDEQLVMLRRGTQAWNAWRAEHYEKVDLSEADLSQAALCGADLSWAVLRGAKLVRRT
jgi:uncharacterized protein YjbI with pentapeptide repeats